MTPHVIGFTLSVKLMCLWRHRDACDGSVRHYLLAAAANLNITKLIGHSQRSDRNLPVSLYMQLLQEAQDFFGSSSEGNCVCPEQKVRICSMWQSVARLCESRHSYFNSILIINKSSEEAKFDHTETV